MDMTRILYLLREQSTPPAINAGDTVVLRAPSGEEWRHGDGSAQRRLSDADLLELIFELEKVVVW